MSTKTDLTEIESQLAAANDAAKVARNHVDAWSKNKSITKGSDLANAVDEHLSGYLVRRADEAAAEADRLGKQVARMKIANRQRALQAEIAENEERLKALQ